MPKKMLWQMNAGKIREEIRWLASLAPEQVEAIRKDGSHPDYTRFERIFNVAYMAQKRSVDYRAVVNAIGWDDGKVEMTFRT